MKYSWSDYCQNAQQLAASRIISLTDSTKEILCRHLPELKGAKILDVGCGTGIFTFFLDDCFQSCEICGLDYDASFVETANHNIPDQMHNQYHFVQGDGYALPFQDEAFDLVISHTYLTSIPDPERALSEKHKILGTEFSAYPNDLWIHLNGLHFDLRRLLFGLLKGLGCTGVLIGAAALISGRNVFHFAAESNTPGMMALHLISICLYCASQELLVRHYTYLKTAKDSVTGYIILTNLLFVFALCRSMETLSVHTAQYSDDTVLSASAGYFGKHRIPLCI